MTIDEIFGEIIRPLGPYALAAFIAYLVIKYLMDALKEERAYSRQLTQAFIEAGNKQVQVLEQLKASIQGGR